jgi:hypothetical protein
VSCGVFVSALAVSTFLLAVNNLAVVTCAIRGNYAILEYQQKGKLMSETAYFFTKEEAEALADLLGQKLDRNPLSYAVLQPVYNKLTRGWTWNTDEEEN